MNCSDDENVCSVKKENNLGYYRLHTIWRKDRFFLNVTSKNGAWRGEMTPSDVAKMSAQLEIEPESYLEQCREALTHHGGKPGMVYMVENGSFEWKKVEDEDSGIKVKMGSVMLEPACFVETIQNLVTAALNCNMHLENKLNELSTEKERLLENKNELQDKLVKLINTKETMEKDLYARFILLNNAKKKKIQELNNLLEEEYKKNKNTEDKSVGNPYEIDTDSDSDFAESKVRNIKRKASQKSRGVKSTLPTEPPEEKKAKNSDDDMNEKSDQYLKYLKSTSEPRTSKDESESTEKELKKMDLKDASTKDDLYNYFYGEL